MTLGENIKLSRKNKGLKQEDLAKRLGVSVMTIRRYENNSRQPKLETINRIATILEVTTNYLLDDYTSSNYPGNIDYLSVNPAEDIKIHPERYAPVRDPETGKIIAYRINKRSELLQAYFEKLNAHGQDTAIQRVEELTKIPEYQKDNNK